MLLILLARFGWAPIVLTVKSQRGDTAGASDASLLDGLPSSIRLVRTINPAALFVRMRGDVGRGPLAGATRAGILGSAVRLVTSAARWLATLVVNPDKYILWVPVAVFRAVQLIRSERINVIYARSNPPSSLVAGYLVKRITGKPLVAEIGDYWTLRAHRQWSSKLRLRIHRFMEREIVREADAITTCFDSSMYEDAYPAARAKFRVMMLGYDLDDFPNEVPTPSGPFTMTYVGKIAGEQYPIEPLLLAIKAVSIPEFQLQLVGRVDKSVHVMVRKMGLERVVRFAGQVDHSKAISMMVASHCQLLIINDSQANFSTNYSTKLFEYLAARRPILALVPEFGRAAEVIRKSKAGVVCSPRDSEAIQRSLRAIYDMGMVASPLPLEGVREFDRADIGRRLSEVLEEVTGISPSGS